MDDSHRNHSLSWRSETIGEHRKLAWHPEDSKRELAANHRIEIIARFATTTFPEGASCIVIHGNFRVAGHNPLIKSSRRPRRARQDGQRYVIHLLSALV